MTRSTLDFVGSLLSRGRYLQHIGRTLDALRILTRLASFRDLPPAVAEEVQFRLGELQLRRKKNKRARRHFSAALRYAPEDPRYHFLLAQALDNDGDLAKAADHYRNSLALDSSQTDCLCAYGHLALRLNRTEEALECLRAAVKLAPDDLTVLAQVASGLRTAGRSTEARGLLLAARFRHPRDGRYRRLWDDFQFHAARRAQDEAQAQTTDDDDRPVLLPFLQPVREEPTRPVGNGKIIRADAPKSLPEPHINPAARVQ